MLKIRFATVDDVPVILSLIKALAAFEKLSHEVTADESVLRKNLFTERKSAEVLLAEKDGETVGCAIFFHSFSTFLGKPGLYLEDLFVLPDQRSSGIGLALLTKLAQLTIDRDCGRLEWSVLNWNQKAIDLYLRLGSDPLNEWTVHRLTGTALTDLAAKA